MLVGGPELAALGWLIHPWGLQRMRRRRSATSPLGSVAGPPSQRDAAGTYRSAMKARSVSSRRVVWAVSALVASGCLAYVVSQFFAARRQPDDGTDATGMYLFSAIVLGIVFLGLVCVFAWLALHREPVPFPRYLPGWYPDPQAPGGSRYWNGATWTSDTR